VVEVALRQTAFESSRDASGFTPHNMGRGTGSAGCRETGRRGNIIGDNAMGLRRILDRTELVASDGGEHHKTREYNAQRTTGGASVESGER
jgi:hypothetical protein